MLEGKFLTYEGVKYPVSAVHEEVVEWCPGVVVGRIISFDCTDGEFCGFASEFDIERVIHNEPATVVLWKDGTKTVVKCSEGDEYDPEKGLLLCIAKKAYGNNGRFNDVLREHVPHPRSLNELPAYVAEAAAFDWDAFKRGEIAARCETLEAALEFNEEADKHGIIPFDSCIVERYHDEGVSYEISKTSKGLYAFCHKDNIFYGRHKDAKTVDYPAKEV